MDSEKVVAKDWVLPNEPRPLRLINTVWADRFEVHDDLTTPVDLAMWFRSVEIAVPKALVTTNALATAREQRDAFRCLAAFVTSDERIRVHSETSVNVAVRLVNELAAASPVAPQLRLRSAELSQQVARGGNALDSALAVLVAEAMELFTSETRHRLTACGGPGCVLYFLKDHTRRGWCSDACGNRARAARHYRRTRTET